MEVRRRAIKQCMVIFVHLVDYLCFLIGASCLITVPPVVFRNDEISLQAIQALVSKGEVDNIVVSPGPGTPKTEQDVGE